MELRNGVWDVSGGLGGGGLRWEPQASLQPSLQYVLSQGPESLFLPPLLSLPGPPSPWAPEPRPCPHLQAWALAGTVLWPLPADTKKMPALRMMLCRVL